MNKREEHVFYQYINAQASDISEVYNCPSPNKKQIFYQIKTRMRACGGKRLRILSHNKQFFSCAYLYKMDSKVYLAVFRPSKNFDIDVTDIVKI